MANEVTNDTRPRPIFAHATIENASLADGATTSVQITCPGASKLAIAVTSDGTYDVDVNWYKSSAFSTQLGATQSVASGASAGTEASVDVASWYAEIVITDTTSDASTASVTGTATMS